MYTKTPRNPNGTWISWTTGTAVAGSVVVASETGVVAAIAAGAATFPPALLIVGAVGAAAVIGYGIFKLFE